MINKGLIFQNRLLQGTILISLLRCFVLELSKRQLSLSKSIISTFMWISELLSVGRVGVGIMRKVLGIFPKPSNTDSNPVDSSETDTNSDSDDTNGQNDTNAQASTENNSTSDSTEGSEVLESLKTLEKKGAKILTCGTCLDYHQRRDKLLIGEIGSMQETVEMMSKADKIISVQKQSLCLKKTNARGRPVKITAGRTAGR